MAPLKFSFMRTRSREQEAEHLQHTTTVYVENLQQINGDNVHLLNADNLQRFNAVVTVQEVDPRSQEKPASPLPSTSQFSLDGTSIQIDSESMDIPYVDELDYQTSTSTNLNTIEETPTRQIDELYNRSREYLKAALQRHRSMESLTPSTVLFEDEDNNLHGFNKRSLRRRSTLPLIKPSTYNLLMMRQNIAQSHLDALLQKHDATVKYCYGMSSSGANLIDDNISSNYSDDCSVIINCGSNKSRNLKKLSDRDMWTASNYVVMKNLLERRGSVEDRMKWEAIAASRGLCTLRTNCGCIDCRVLKTQNLASEEGDGGLGVAPLFLNSCSVM